MVKRFLRDWLQFAIIIVALLWGVRWSRSSSSGYTAGYSGAPGENNCSSCHSTAQTNLSKFSFTGRPSSYSFSQAYSITLSGAVRGFQLTARRIDNNTPVGSWTAGTNTNKPDANHVGHTNAGTTRNFTWTAPSSNVGTIRWYVAGPDGYPGTTYLATYDITAPATPSITSLSHDFGSAASTVTLTGTNFVGATSTVTIGAANATNCSGSDTSLNCKVPNGAAGADGNINVIVVSAGGTSAAKPFYFISGAPSPASIAPVFGASTDSARALTITGTRFSKNGFSVKLTRSGQSDIAALNSVAASSQSIAATLNLSGATTGQWNVVVANPDAQSGTLTNGYLIQALPPAPSALIGTATSTGSVHWEWTDNSDNENGFRVLTSTGGLIVQLASNTTFYEEGGFALGNAQYTRFVRAFNDIGVADSGNASATTFTAAPAGPAASVVGVSSLTYVWTGNNGPGTTYNADLAIESAFNAPVSSSTQNTTATFTGLSVNTTYYFRVMASGNGSSAFTATVSTPTLANPPSGTQPDYVDETQFEFLWQPNGNPVDVTRYVAQMSSNSFAAILSSSTQFTHASFIGLTPNTTFQYRVRTENHAGVPTAFDSTLVLVTYAMEPGLPSLVLRTSDSLSIGWSGNGNPAGTVFKAELAPEDQGSILQSSFTRNTQATFATLDPSTSYYFRVTAIDHTGRESNSTAFVLARTAPVNLVPPANLQAFVHGTSSISWTWDTVANAVSYIVYAASNTQPGAALVTGVTPPITRLNLDPNVGYGLRVAGVNGDGEEGPLSATTTVYTLATPPTATSALSVSSRTVTVSFDLGTASVYSLERSQTNNSSYVQRSTTFTVTSNSASFSDTLLPAGSTWFYRVRGFNGSGIATAYDAEVSTRTRVADVPPPNDASALTLGVSSLTWSWSPVAGASNYRLLRSSDQSVISASISTNSFTQTGLATNTQYGVQLRSINGDTIAGPLSGEFVGYTDAEAPTGSAVTVLSSTSLRVQWNAANATYYQVQRATFSNAGNSFAAVSGLNFAATQFTDSGLSPETTYYYRVRSINVGGQYTAFDAEVFAKTLAAPPGAPIFSGVIESTDSIRWSWTYSGASISSYSVRTDTFGVVAVLSPTATTYLETGLDARTSYTRYVRAHNGSGAMNSNLVTLATPDVLVGVSAGSPTTATGLDGVTYVEIPAGAFAGFAGLAAISVDPANAPLTPEAPTLITSANAALVGLYGPATSVREFLAIVNGARFTGTFSSPVTICIPYSDPEPDGIVNNVTPPIRATDLRVYTLNETSSRWEALNNATLDTVNLRVCAQTTHFSLFTILAAPGAADLSGLKLYPQPWKPGSSGAYDATGVTFDNLTAEGTIKIFTIAGELVRVLDYTSADGGKKVWDGRNASAKKVASGVYLYYINTSSGSKTGRLAVVR